MSSGRLSILILLFAVGVAVIAWLSFFAGSEAVAPSPPTPAQGIESPPARLSAPGRPVGEPAPASTAPGVRDRVTLAERPAAGSAPTAAREPESEDAPADRPWTGDSPRFEGLSEGAEPSDEPEDEGAAPTGFLAAESIQAGIHESLGEIRECYEGWLGRNPNLEGELLVEFTIATDEEDEELGVVTAIDITDSTVDHVWMEGCVASVMQDVQFPPPEGGEVKVKYPFRFSSEE